MNEPPFSTEFLAVLVYDERNGRCCEETRVYQATHPEIAYRMALADGREQRYGREFIGLSRLEESHQEIMPMGVTKKGDAQTLVAEKQDLAAFQDPRWKNRPCDEREIQEALQEPTLLFEIEGLEDIPWHKYSHAYGSASEVPTDIRRLLSSDGEIREQASWELGGSIYHQGTIYSATAVAVPFLIRVACDPRTPDSDQIWSLLEVIAESSAIEPDDVRKGWAWRTKMLAGVYDVPAEGLADELAMVESVRAAFLANLSAIREAASRPESNPSATSILAHFEPWDAENA